MRAVIQRVLNASVTVNGSIISEIGPGLMVLVGVKQSDTIHDAQFILRKILGVKMFDNAAGKPWAANVVDKQYSILLVSQFTLMAEFKGNRPDFHSAMDPANARQFYDEFVQSVQSAYSKEKVLTGEFGADMKVALVNDGPVTFELDTTGMDWSIAEKKAARPFAKKPVTKPAADKTALVEPIVESNQNIEPQQSSSG